MGEYVKATGSIEFIKLYIFKPYGLFNAAYLFDGYNYEEAYFNESRLKNANLT